MPLADFLSQLNVLDPKKVRIVFEEKENTLKLNVDGKLLGNLTPAKPFPITFPEYIIFRDSYGVDVCIVQSFNELDEESKRNLQIMLEKMYFIPKITEKESIETSDDEFEWETQTDKGSKTFRTRGRMSIIPMGNRIIVTDVDDNIYEIEDIYKLNNKSRKEIEGTI